MYTTRCTCGKMQESYIVSNETHTNKHVFVFKTEIIFQMASYMDMKPVPVLTQENSLILTIEGGFLLDLVSYKFALYVLNGLFVKE